MGSSRVKNEKMMQEAGVYERHNTTQKAGRRYITNDGGIKHCMIKRCRSDCILGTVHFPTWKVNPICAFKKIIIMMCCHLKNEGPCSGMGSIPLSRHSFL